MTVDKREAALWVALCKANWSAQATWDTEQHRALARGYRNGLLDAWCILTGEDIETVGEHLQDAMVVMAEGGGWTLNSV